MNTILDDILKTDSKVQNTKKLPIKDYTTSTVNYRSIGKNNDYLPIALKKIHLPTESSNLCNFNEATIQNLETLTKNNYLKTRNLGNKIQNSYTETINNEVLRSKTSQNASISLTKKNKDTISSNFCNFNEATVQNLKTITKNNFLKTRNLRNNIQNSYTESINNEVLRSKASQNASISLTKKNKVTITKFPENNTINFHKDSTITSTINETPNKLGTIEKGKKAKLDSNFRNPLVTENNLKTINKENLHVKNFSFDLVSKYNKEKVVLEKHNILSNNFKDSPGIGNLNKYSNNAKFQNDNITQCKDSFSKTTFDVALSKDSKFKHSSVVGKNEFKKFYKKNGNSGL